MITLTLLHPVQSTPVQSWSFDQNPVIQIGRAVDNHVVLYSAVVSRYHVELRQNGSEWEVVNQGTNGTYLDGKRVHQAPLADGSILRLARSGPNLQIRLGNAPDPNSLESKPTQAEVPAPELIVQTAPVTPPITADPDPKATSLPLPDLHAFHVIGQHVWPPRSQVDTAKADCQHQRAEPRALVCIDCGQPLHVLHTVGEYKVLKALGTREQNFIAWRGGHVVVLKTLNPTLSDPSHLQLFRKQAQSLCELSHPGMPKIYEAFEHQGQIFLVSEMIYGQTLKQLVVSQGPLSPPQVSAWAIDVSHLLSYLHQQESPLVHQSLKPSNLIRPTIPHGLSQVVLVNFGDLSVPSEAGTAIGSVAYTAPEQPIGKPSPASDLYSLGATMIYLLTQQDPDAFYRLGNQEAQLAVEDIPGLDADMAQVLARLTHPEPAQRYESALQVAEVLQPLT
ncbi:MAG: FHA domain-containing protein [Thermosynechococcaceae cyanobacterium]